MEFVYAGTGLSEYGLELTMGIALVSLAQLDKVISPPPRCADGSTLLSLEVR